MNETITVRVDELRRIIKAEIELRLAGFSASPEVEAELAAERVLLQLAPPHMSIP
jgi:hypothetical protein